MTHPLPPRHAEVHRALRRLVHVDHLLDHDDAEAICQQLGLPPLHEEKA